MAVMTDSTSRPEFELATNTALSDFPKVEAKREEQRNCVKQVVGRITGNIKQCLKTKRIEILNSFLFCLILFTSLFKEASQKYSGLFSSIQCSIKYNVLYEWSLSMIYHCGAQF